MKQRIYSFVLLTLLLVSASIVSVNAATTETTQAETTTVKNTKVKAKKVKKTIKANDEYSIKKALKIKTSKIDNYTFTSSNKKVAEVSEDGVVTGKAKGTAKITVKTSEDNTKVAVYTIKVKNRYTETQLRYMASIIYCEARGECYAGQKAVGIVVMNRMKSDKYPSDIKSVIYQRGQFTPTANGAMAKALTIYDRGKLKKSCINAAKEVLNGDTTVDYNGETYDLDGYLFFSRYVPNSKLTIQNHMFK